MFFAGLPHFLWGAHGHLHHPIIHMFLFGFELSFFTLLSYIAGYCVLLFLAISLACGLYYLAELTEEYPSITKKVIQISNLLHRLSCCSFLTTGPTWRPFSLLAAAFFTTSSCSPSPSSNSRHFFSLVAWYLLSSRT